jgi:hypothetical protein
MDRKICRDINLLDTEKAEALPTERHQKATVALVKIIFQFSWKYY